jgi:hypothetical protein
MHANVRKMVDDASGRAIAAVLLDKPSESVTPAEAATALADPVAVNDRPRTNRAIRAGILAAVSRLSPDCIHPAIARLVEDGIVMLDAGQSGGWTTPEPGRRSWPGERALHSHWFALEIAFQIGRLGCSRDHAIGVVTGVWRDGRRPAGAEPPVLRWSLSFEALKKLLKQGEDLDLQPIAEARDAGEAVRKGQEPPADLMRKRREILAVWPVAGPTGKRRRR